MVIQKLQEKLFILKGRTIALLGLAFKPDTDDLRDAPSLEIAERLLRMGARVRAYDPVAMQACREQYPELKLRYCESAREAAAGADALVVVTEWREFRHSIWRCWPREWRRGSWWTAAISLSRRRPSRRGSSTAGWGVACRRMAHGEWWGRPLFEAVALFADRHADGLSEHLHAGRNDSRNVYARASRRDARAGEHVNLAGFVFQLVPSGPEDADRIRDRSSDVHDAVLVPRRVGVDAPDFHGPQAVSRASIGSKGTSWWWDVRVTWGVSVKLEAGARASGGGDRHPFDCAPGGAADRDGGVSLPARAARRRS